MVKIAPPKIMLIIFAMSLVCAIIAIATDSSLFSYSDRNKAYGSFLIIAIISLGIVLFIELLLNFVGSLSENRIMQILSIAFMVLAGVSLIISCSIYSTSHMPYGWTVASCTLIMEGILIFLVLRFCS